MQGFISRQAAIDALYDWSEHSMTDAEAWHIKQVIGDIKSLPSSQPQYEEITPEEAASEIASGSILRASYWLDIMIALKQMGYAICRKKG